MTRAVARLALGKTRPLRNVEKHLRAVDDWAAEFAGFFPPPGDAFRLCAHWHVPVDQRLVDPPDARPEHQRRVLQAMIDAAAHLAAARPAERAGDKIYVLITGQPCSWRRSGSSSIKPMAATSNAEPIAPRHGR